MWLLYALCFILCAVYCTIIVAYQRWFNKLKAFEYRPFAKLPHLFSVIIPARNEEKNIARCLQSVFSNTYPLDSYEVIIIDDFSTDNTNHIVFSLQKTYSNLQLHSLAEIIDDKDVNAYKKKAIELAIAKAKGNWIVTTDADCIVPVNWLDNLNNYIHQTSVVCIAAPVSFINAHSFLSIFQSLDFMSLQGITAASVSAGFHSMCNGANFAYNKEAFYKVGGFTGIDNIASGDDMLLMHKIKKMYPGEIGFLFSPLSTVQTLPMSTWKDFFNQRIRWASKTKNYNDKNVLYVLMLVYLFNAVILTAFFTAFFIRGMLACGLIMLLLKTIFELYFLLPVAKFFNQQQLLWWFPIMQPFHIVYTFIAGGLGVFGKYKWKGRLVK